MESDNYKPTKNSISESITDNHLNNIQTGANSNDNRFKCVVSVGSRCFTEIFLKELGLKKFSTMFDGMYNSSISDIINVMENGLKPNDLVYTSELNDKLLEPLVEIHGHRTMHKKINYNKDDLTYSYHKAFLPHHDLSLPNVKTHFERCCTRMEIIKNKKIKTLFCLFIFPNYDKDLKITYDDILILSNYLGEHYNCHLLVCNFSARTMNREKWRVLNEDEALTFININSGSHAFQHNAQALREIMNKMNVKCEELLSYGSIV